MKDYRLPTEIRGAFGLISLAGILLALSAVPGSVRASCDQIPGTANTFRSALGNVSRPFASPGDYFEIRLGATCDAASPGFLSSAAEHVVTFVFQPPDGPRNVVVLASDCDALSAERSECAAQPGVARVTCLPFLDGDIAGVQVLERDGARRLRVRFPDTDLLVGEANDERTLTGPTAVAVARAGEPLPCGLASATCEEQIDVIACVDRFFRIDGQCGRAPHEYLSGFVALPPPNDAQALCVEPSSICTGRAREMCFTVDASGNVLLPMDWQGVLLPGSVPVARLLRTTAALEAFPGSGEPLRLPLSALLRSLSLEGSLLPPVFEPRLDPSDADRLVLFGSVDAPRTVLFIGRRAAAFRECHGGEADGRACLETSECPAGACGAARCKGGANDGRDCASDGACPGGQCGSLLFDFNRGLVDGVGPVAVPRFGAGICQDSLAPCRADAECGASRCVSFKIVAEEPVPLEALVETPDLLVSVVPEAIDGRDLNGDDDAIDDVLLMTDRRTGRRQSIGVGGAPGLAATRIRDLPFNYPAVVAEGDLVALLEAEPHEGRGDLNGDGDDFDTILRVFRGAGPLADELTPRGGYTVDAAPLVDGRVMVLTNGLLWFRSAESSRVPQVIERVSVTADGAQADGASRRPAISADGRQVGFESRAPNLLPAGGGFSAFVRDRRSADTIAITLEHDELPSQAPALTPSLSGDGRFVAVETRDVDALRQIFLFDRDADRDGVFDEPGGVETIPGSAEAAFPDRFGNDDSAAPLLSADGRRLTFTSDATNLFAGLLINEGRRTYLRDRDRLGGGLFEHDELPGGEPNTTNNPVSRSMMLVTQGGGDGSLQQSAPVSQDGLQVAFASVSNNISPGDRNDFCLNFDGRTSCSDVYVYDDFRIVADMDANPTELASVSSIGEQGNNQSHTPAMSAGGRFVAFLSAATNLVPGDTNGVTDVFVRDRSRGTTARLSVASDAREGDGGSFDRTLSVSADGRYVAFGSIAGNLVANDRNDLCDNDLDGKAGENCGDVFLHDRLTGFTRRISVGHGGAEGDGRSGSPAMSADGEVVAFESAAATLIDGDSNDFCDTNRDGRAEDNCQDVFIARPDTTGSSGDLDGDGDAEDTVLHVLDVTESGAEPVAIAPARAVALSGGCAALLVPEHEVGTGTDLNGDGDTSDHVVHLYCRGPGGGMPRNLGLAAIAVDLSRETIAALVPTTGQPHPNQDGGRQLGVLHVARVDDPAAWTDTGVQAQAVSVAGRFVAFLTMRAVVVPREGAITVVRLYDAAAQEMSPLDEPAEEFVLGDRLLAFRTLEENDGVRDRNGDGDARDGVLRIYDLGSRRLIETGQSVVPCDFASCDPGAPYRVFGDTVTFLTFEGDQGRDLTGNGDQQQLVLQMFNAAFVRATPALGRAALATGSGPDTARALTVVAAVSAGVCTDSGQSCATDAECGAGATCHLPPGQCVAAIADRPCDLDAPGNPCAPDAFCVPTGEPGKGTCHAALGPCERDGDCEAPARCFEGAERVARLLSPLSAQSADSGASVVIAAGRCVEDLGVACALGGDSGCKGGESCETGLDGTATCYRRHGTCRNDADCPASASCTREIVVSGAADVDVDGIADPFDNCPSVSNIDQADDDADGIGDACAVSSASPTPTSTVPITSPIPTVEGNEGDGCAISAHNRDRGSLVVLALLVASSAVRRRRR